MTTTVETTIASAATAATTIKTTTAIQTTTATKTTAAAVEILGSSVGLHIRAR